MNENILEQIGITQDVLIEKLTERILGLTAGYNQTSAEEWHEIPFSDVVDSKIENALKGFIDKMNPFIQQRIEEIMSAKIEEVFTQPFQRVDSWGKPLGEPVTIKDLIAEQAQSYWTTKVNECGEISSNYGTKIPRSEYYAKKVMEEVYNQELVKTVKKMAVELKNKIPETISEEITKTVLKHLK